MINYLINYYFYDLILTQQTKKTIIFVLVGQTRKAICEESPSTAEQSRLITSSQGDLRKSATERYRHYGKGEKVREELTRNLGDKDSL